MTCGLRTARRCFRDCSLALHICLVAICFGLAMVGCYGIAKWANSQACFDFDEHAARTWVQKKCIVSGTPAIERQGYGFQAWLQVHVLNETRNATAKPYPSWWDSCGGPFLSERRAKEFLKEYRESFIQYDEAGVEYQEAFMDYNEAFV